MATEDDIEWWEHPDQATMAAEVAGDVTFLLSQAVDGHGAAVLAVPPSAEAALLLATIFKTHGPWQHVTVVPTHGTLAGESAAAALAVGAKVAALDAAEAAGDRIDLAWLDVGENGRVGGIDPGAGLAEAMTSPHRVRTAADGSAFLTGSALLGARALIVTARGDGERAVLEEAIADGAGSRLPVGRLLAEAEQAIDIHWCP